MTYSRGLGAGCEAAEAGELNQLIISEDGGVSKSLFVNLDQVKRWLGSNGPAGRHFF